MVWVPRGVPVVLEPQAAFALSDIEESMFARCPARVGISARKGSASPQPPSQPFGETMFALIRDLVEAIVVGRRRDADGGLARAARGYRGQHSAIRSFLDCAGVNYLEFLEDREAQVGPLTYLGYSNARPVGSEVSLKLWAPLFKDAAGNREVHRLRYRSAKKELTTWARGAAWVAAEGGASQVSVLEVGLADGGQAVICDSLDNSEIDREHRQITLPRLREVYLADDPQPGSDCTRCAAVAVCPAIVPMAMFGAAADNTPWVRGLSESSLARHRACPHRELARSQHLPRSGSLPEPAARGLRVHSWIHDAHESGRSCRDYFSSVDLLDEDRPYLDAHAANCARSDLEVLSAEETLVGWDSAIGDVVYMKPDEVLRRDGAVILREIKTTSNSAALDPAVAWDQYAQVLLWWASALRGGLLAHFGASRGTVELEVLTPDGGAVHSWEMADPEVGFQIDGWRLDSPALWLADRTFPANPGAQCAECDVLRWCREGQDFE